MATKFIEPNEQHFLKAVAWDALYTACHLEDSPSFRNLKSIMERTLVETGERLSYPGTWSVSMKKFENEKMYHCRACGTAHAKEAWEPMWVPSKDLAKEELGRTFYVCPHCGVLMDIHVANVVDEPVQEADAPEPKSPPKKK